MSITTIETTAAVLPQGKATSRATRILVAVSLFVSRLVGKVVDEVLYMLREDLAHGRIERQPEDWER